MRLFQGVLAVLSLTLLSVSLAGDVQPKIPFCLINYNTSPRLNVLIIDNSRKRLWVYDNQRPDPVESFEFRGNGIPEGIFFFKKVLMGFDIPESAPLSNKVYVLDYPNSADQFEGPSQHKPLYLYGTGGNFQAGKSGKGSIDIILSEIDMSKLSRYILLRHTPFIVCDKVRFVSAKRLNRMRDGFLRQLSAWRACRAKKDWQGLDGFYAPGVSPHSMELNRQSQFLTLRLDALKVFYCGKYYTAVFNRLEVSDNNCGYERVTQYWRHRPHESKIIAETALPLPRPLNIEQYHIAPVHIEIEEISITPTSIRLNIGSPKQGLGLTCIPVAILEENNKTVYRSLPGVSLKKGAPLDYKHAIRLSVGSTSLHLAKEERHVVRSITLFVAGQDEKTRQIKTYFIGRELE